MVGSRNARGHRALAGRSHDARTYINHPRGVRIDDGRLVVDSICRWFEGDFGGGSDSGVIARLREYAVEPLASELSAFERIADDDYDWTLNDATAR